MILWVLLVAVALGGGIGGSPAVTVPTDVASENSKPIVVVDVEEEIEVVMETGELNPNHYPAQRAAKVVQHYLNTQHGSPYKVFGLGKVFKAYAEDVPGSGRKYQLELSVDEMVHKQVKIKTSAEVIFPREQTHPPLQVHVPSDDDFLKINTSVQEEAFYQQYKTNQSLFAQNLPDSYGHIEPEHVPFWHLGIVVSSFVMLNQSTEETLYNMAQVANVTQIASDEDLLKFEYDVLLHDMVSQDIIAWKVLTTWSPPEGVKILTMEKRDYVVNDLKTTLL
ncbi:latexin isoform X2 [Syngnathus scovelli]|uniref:latexin isoform X2 n=1 Tax=Syngnathus scovelli TaxID=161590 RepID=UPI00210F2CD4|nr:latexin isoform X3 [Syngnathus scovelli]